MLGFRVSIRIELMLMRYEGVDVDVMKENGFRVSIGLLPLVLIIS